MKKIGVIICLLWVCVGLFAQTHTHVYNEQIRTLRVEREVLMLDDLTPLHISFDEMSHDVHFYTYTVQMLNDGMLSSEYLQGFTTKDITDYEHSINTSREYTHYWFDFPNEDMTLTKSGNYRLTIYEDGNPDNKVAEVDFCVVEPLVKIETNVRANTDVEFNGRFQQLDIEINTTALDLRDPNEVRLVVTQNNRFDNAVQVDKPTFIEPNRLRYINNKALIFEGGNEYHHFDAFSCFYAGIGIDRVYHELGDYHALLFTDEITQGQYIHQFDSDGRFVVNAERTNDSDTEAEYMWVYWTLPMDKPFFDGSLYVGGEIFGNELGLSNRMQYDTEAKVYWLTALVKQGGYDYQYWFCGKGSQNKTTTQRVDGSYWQTENEYAVYVYWRPFGARYDRLVGVQVIRSNAL
ncbi:MAG: DUF5103 domain-containing protein [Paludibacteraceae bacterium]|nr:DUF5103 domain-containing protein [Paludibacteraceae bacterium]